jgi:hypothetical protein
MSVCNNTPYGTSVTLSKGKPAPGFAPVVTVQCKSSSSAFVQVVTAAGRVAAPLEELDETTPDLGTGQAGDSGIPRRGGGRHRRQS